MATSLSAQREENKKKNNELSDKRAAVVNANADASIKDVGTAYDDQQRTIAVQKLINERKVAESMANLGLTDSGLNRTQQTAVQLSAANAGYALNRQKQADISKINLQRDNSLSEIEQNRLATEMEIDNTYDALEAEERAAKAKAAAEQVSANNAAQEKASYMIRTTNGLLRSDYEGTLKSNGVDCYAITKDGEEYIRYVDNKSGKTLELPKGVSPYTGSINKDIYNGGAFENGYQPNNINGVKLQSAKLANGQIATYTVDGLNYRIHKANGKFYRWDRKSNSYIELTNTNGLY
ncbi:MAG: hypothetical protein IKV81_03675 [Clostridia bacterium]|nr:hypothetical protein [Clostridia bacterium]